MISVIHSHEYVLKTKSILYYSIRFDSEYSKSKKEKQITTIKTIQHNTLFMKRFHNNRTLAEHNRDEQRKTHQRITCHETFLG